MLRDTRHVTRNVYRYQEWDVPGLRFRRLFLSRELLKKNTGVPRVVIFSQNSFICFFDIKLSHVCKFLKFISNIEIYDFLNE